MPRDRPRLIPDPDDPITRVVMLTEWIAQNIEARDEAVLEARDEGYTWAEIGTALGISKQAAHAAYGDASA